MALLPLINGLFMSALGGALGAGLAAAIRTAAGLPAWDVEQAITLGYLFALPGWVMGVGGWEVWGREWFGLPVKFEHSQHWSRYFRFDIDHKVVGIQYLVTFVVLFLFAGLLAMVIRAKLMAPGLTFITPDQYNTVLGLHGIIMVAVALAALMGGFANFMLPLMIGAEDVAFPRLNALSFWIVPPVGVLLLATPFAGGFDTGWTAYPPLSVVNAHGGLLFLLAFITFGLSSILGGLNFLVTVTTMRAPGMTWGRLPIFVWGVFAASLISFAGTQFAAAALLMVILDRVAGTSFFAAANGGKPLLFEHVFWFYSHPAVYIMVLPAFGLALEVLSHFSRKPVFAYRWVASSFIAVVALGFIVWAHHIFTSGMADYMHIPIMITTELISIPTGMVFLSALGTIWQGRLWLKTPMLFALGFVFNFVIGGITGIYLADVPTDIHLHGTYFVVAHFHYTIVGGEIFVMMAGIYYWFPKITGRMYNEAMGKVHFWWMFVGYNLTFLTMFKTGLDGMNRRIADYPPYLAETNWLVSIFAFTLGASFVVFFFNLALSWVMGPRASANPWRARTLEWQTSSPPPLENFLIPPVVTEHPYDYGVVKAPVQVAAAAPEAAPEPEHEKTLVGSGR